MQETCFVFWWLPFIQKAGKWMDPKNPTTLNLFTRDFSKKIPSIFYQQKTKHVSCMLFLNNIQKGMYIYKCLASLPSFHCNSGATLFLSSFSWDQIEEHNMFSSFQRRMLHYLQSRQKYLLHRMILDLQKNLSNIQIIDSDEWWVMSDEVRNFPWDCGPKFISYIISKNHWWLMSGADKRSHSRKLPQEPAHCFPIKSFLVA